MAGKVKEVKIFGYDFEFVFRHRYEKDEDDNLIDSFTLWNEWQLGFFFKRDKVVGKRNFGKPKDWNNNLVNSYLLGIDLLICKAWFTISKGTMKINIDEK